MRDLATEVRRRRSTARLGRQAVVVTALAGATSMFMGIAAAGGLSVITGSSAIPPPVAVPDVPTVETPVVVEVEPPAPPPANPAAPAPKPAKPERPDVVRPNPVAEVAQSSKGADDSSWRVGERVSWSKGDEPIAESGSTGGGPESGRHGSRWPERQVGAPLWPESGGVDCGPAGLQSEMDFFDDSPHRPRWR